MLNALAILCARAAADRELATLEQDQRLALTELELLQKDFDAVSTTVRMLEMQKSEAQKRIDELDDKVSFSFSHFGSELVLLCTRSHH